MGVWIVLLIGVLTLVRMELPTGKGVHSSIPFTGVEASIEAMACGEARVWGRASAAAVVISVALPLTRTAAVAAERNLMFMMSE